MPPAGVVALAVARCPVPPHLLDDVCVEEGPLDEPPFALTDAERERLCEAVPARVRDVASGGRRARTACARLGVADAERAELVPDAAGAPAWPDGLVGSITHGAGWAAAAVAPNRLVASLGIDVEPAQGLPAGVLGVIASREEQEMLADWGGPGWSGQGWGERLLFSAKESVYKAWYPLTGSWLDFGDVVVGLGPPVSGTGTGTGTGTVTGTGGTWSASMRREGRSWDVVGGWAEVGGRLATALVVLPDGPRCRRG